MSKISIRWIAALAAVAILCMPETVLPQTAEPCADVEVSVNPAVAMRGNRVLLAASITNCSTARQTYTIKYELTTPCTRMVMFSIRLKFLPGQSLAADLPFRIPFFACTGDYTLTVSVSSGGTLLDSSSATLTVL